jgi:hypothetical protein
VLCAAQVLLYKRQANQGSFKPQLAMLQSVLDEARQQQQQLAHSNPLPQHGPTATDMTAAQAAAAAAIDAAASRALAHGLGSSHGVRGIRKKGAGEGCKWEMRSGLVYSKPKQYSSWHATSVEAAVAFDLIKLAVQGEGAAVNLPESVYTAQDVAAMAALVQHKRKIQLEQQQQQQGLGVSRALDQQPPQQQQEGGAEEQQQQQQLLLNCLTVKAGRQLLTLPPETGIPRLQALASLTGISSSELLSRGLQGGDYLGQVLGLSGRRLLDSALALQQHLGLQEADLQQLLRAEPSLLHLRSDTLQHKVALLLPAFSQLCDALQDDAAAAAEGYVAAAAPATSARKRLLGRHRQQQRQWHQHLQDTAPGSSVDARLLVDDQQQQQLLLQDTSSLSSASAGSAELRGQWRSQQQLQDTRPDSSAGAGLAALQRAVLSQPQVLGLAADRVVRRLQVLQQCCCYPVLAAQVLKVLQTGTIGRWLAAGNAAAAVLQASGSGVCAIVGGLACYGVLVVQLASNMAKVLQRVYPAAEQWHANSQKPLSYACSGNLPARQERAICDVLPAIVAVLLGAPSKHVSAAFAA